MMIALGWVFLTSPFLLSDTEKAERISELAYAELARSRIVQAPQEPQKTKQELNHERDIAKDREVGAKYSAQADREYRPTKNLEMQRRVDRIGKELAEIANVTKAEVLWGDRRLSKFDYTFKVVESKDINAFSIPGGYIYVFEGLINDAESDDELAGVLAHEIAHASFRHVATLEAEQEKLQRLTLPLILLSLLGGGAAAVPTLMGSQLLTTAVGNGWSQKAESASDYGGLQYMLKTKYNPTGILTFMERMASRERGNFLAGELGILRTHPPGRERAQSLITYLGIAGIPIQRSKVTTSYRATVRSGDNNVVDVYFGKFKVMSFGGTDALRKADEFEGKLNAFMDSEPQMYEVTPGPDGMIYGKRRLLLDLDHDDAVLANTTVDTLQIETIGRIRAAVLGLSFRLWDSK